MTSISFDGHNVGLQAGVINGNMNNERSETNNSKEGAIFSGNITANGDVNIHNITTVRPLAKYLFKSLFSSSELFGQIRDKLGLLVAILNEIEEHTQGVEADDRQIPGLKEALDNCHTALHDLSQLKDHFDGVPTQTQVTWKRMGWAEDELVRLSSKLTVYIDGLNLLNANMIRSSHENVERTLRRFMNDIRTGKRESSAMSSVSTGSLSADKKEEWRQLRKELQSIGITPEIFAHNREFILNTLSALSQNENECYCNNLGRIEEEEFSPEPTSDFAYDSSESERQDDMVLLPQVRPNGTTNSATNDDATFNEAPGERSYECLYEGYTFFKVDPAPGAKAIWRLAEPIHIWLSQKEISRMVRKRSLKKSPAQQYLDLSSARRAHVDLLIHQRRADAPFIGWSLVYAKSHRRPTKNLDVLDDKQGYKTYETVSINVILMKTPIDPGMPMGDSTDLRLLLCPNAVEPPWPPPSMESSEYQYHQALVPSQAIGPEYVVEEDLPLYQSISPPLSPDSHGSKSYLELDDNFDDRAELPEALLSYSDQGRQRNAEQTSTIYDGGEFCQCNCDCDDERE